MQDNNRYQILCLTGHPGSGKTTISNKLVRDQKYHRIVVSENDRISLSEQDLVANITRQITQSNTEKILLEGFPMNKREAVRFENSFTLFQLIILLECPHDLLAARRALKDKNSIPYSLKATIDSNEILLMDLAEFYNSFGLLFIIKNQNDSDLVYLELKGILRRNIIFLYGPLKADNEEISKELCNRIGYHYVSLREFYASRGNKSPLAIVNQFTSTIKRLPYRSLIIDDMFETKEEYLVFQQELGSPERIYFLDFQKDEVQVSITSKSQHRNKEAHRDTYLKFVENRPKILAQIKDKSFFRKIKGSHVLKDVEKLIINDLKPTVVSAFYNLPQEGQFLKEFEKERGWKIIDLQLLKQSHVQRKTDIGKKILNAKNNSKIVSIKLILALLRDCLFGKPHKKVILINMGAEMDLFESVQHQLFQLSLLEVEFQKLAGFKDKDHPLLHYFEKGKLFKIRQKRTQLLDAMLQPSIKYGIVFGPPSSGKTTLTKNLAKQYGMVQIDWEQTIERVKEKYLTEQEQTQEQVPVRKILKYLKETFQSNVDKTYILDSVSNDKILSDIQKHLGLPTFIINKQVSKQALIQRFRTKEASDLSAEVTEEQTLKIEQALKKGQFYANWSRDLSESNANTKNYNIDSSGTLDATLSATHALFSRRVYIVYQEVTNSIIKVQISNLFRNIAYNSDILYINVDNLVQTAFNNKDCPLGHLLRSEYESRADEQVNSSLAGFYTPSLVIKLIKRHIDGTNQSYRDYMLINYPTPKKQGDPEFPLISDQLATIENLLGEIQIITAITKTPVQFSIQAPALILERPIGEQKIIKEGEDAVAEQPAPGQQDKKPTFSIYDYAWTDSKSAKTIGQFYCSIKPFVDKIKVNMPSYQDIGLYEDYFNYVEEVKKNPKSYFFIEVMRQF